MQEIVEGQERPKEGWAKELGEILEDLFMDAKVGKCLKDRMVSIIAK